VQTKEIHTHENEDHSLSGKRVVILGGTSGIGFATAMAAAHQGASIVVASSSKRKVESALSRLPAGAEGEVIDLSSEERVRDFFAGTGEFDHLVFTGSKAHQKTGPESCVTRRGFAVGRDWRNQFRTSQAVF
jgi:NAD(P)-dependent dehydrogenase (short-subunit alcohol dehydrogenase family)